MALLTKDEFAEKFGIESKNLYSYFSRTGAIRVVLRPDGLIDDQDLLNRPFIQKRQSFVKRPQQEPKEIISSAPPVITERSVKNKNQGSFGTIGSDSLSEDLFPALTLLDVKTKKQIEELEKKIQLYETKIAKANEESIPKEHASFLIKNYSIGIKNEWLSATRRFMMQKAISLGLSREEIIEHEQFIVEIVNDAVKKGAEEANRNIRKLAMEFAGKKGKGERE